MLKIFNMIVINIHILVLHWSLINNNWRYVLMLIVGFRVQGLWKLSVLQNQTFRLWSEPSSVIHYESKKYTKKGVANIGFLCKKNHGYVICCNNIDLQIIYVCYKQFYKKNFHVYHFHIERRPSKYSINQYL